MGGNYKEVDLTANALINVGAIHESPTLNSSTYSINSNTSTKTLYSFQSDEIGNITNIGNVTVDWNGRRLESISQNGTVVVSYDYNIDGQRTKKTALDLETGDYITTEFFYNGDILAGQKKGDDVIIFMYDNNGDIFGFTYNGTPYYYVKNAQNDVFLILDENGQAVVIYLYDAWGRVNGCLDVTDFGLATINPIMYRSYYVDLEMGMFMYYLNSRYYMADWGRFVSADSYVQTGQGVLSNNMFAYCMNNPVKFVDSNGESATIAGAIIGGLFGFVGALISEATDDNEGIRMDKVLACTLSGAATGAAIGFVADVAVATFGVGLGMIATGIAGAALSAGNSWYTQKTLTGDVKREKVIVDAIFGGLTAGLCTGTSSTISPIVTGLKEGIKYAGTQIAKEMTTFYFIGQVESVLAMDIGFTAVTSFGAWYGAEIFGVLIGWCE